MRVCVYGSTGERERGEEDGAGGGGERETHIVHVPSVLPPSISTHPHQHPLPTARMPTTRASITVAACTYIVAEADTYRK